MELIFFAGAVILWTVLMKPRSIPFLVLAGLSLLIPGYFLIAALVDPDGLTDIGKGIAFVFSSLIVLGGLAIANFLLLVERIANGSLGWPKTLLNVSAWAVLLAADALAVGIFIIGWLS